MPQFDIKPLPLAGLKLVQRTRLGDSRGYLSRLFCAEQMALGGWSKPIVQLNHTYTAKRGSVRGLHFQRPPFSEMKLVNCIAGEIWDVAVDLRPESETFLHWHAEHLSAEDGRAMLIPEGFAHGFQSLSDHVELIYCHSAAYHAESEGGLNPADPKLAIDWPLAITEISVRDSHHPLLDEQFAGVAL